MAKIAKKAEFELKAGYYGLDAECKILKEDGKPAWMFNRWEADTRVAEGRAAAWVFVPKAGFVWVE